MRREGTDPENVQMEDVPCDSCRRSWTEEVAFIEGRHGICGCANCLTVAYRRAVMSHATDTAPSYRGTICLEERPDPCHQTPTHPEGFICERCVKLASGALVRDKESGWTRPG